MGSASGGAGTVEVYVLVRQILPEGEPEVLAVFSSLLDAVRHAHRFYAIHPEWWAPEPSGQEWRCRDMIDSAMDCLFVVARKAVQPDSHM